MATECVCDAGLSSLFQRRDCKSYLKKAVGVMPIQRAVNGVKNFIDLSTIPVPETAYQAMFQDANPAKRLHAIYDIKNTTLENQDGTQKDWDDGTFSELEDGNLTFTFIVPETDLLFIGGVKGLKCQNPDSYIRMADGSQLGYADRDTIATDKKMYPLPIENWTTSVLPFSTDSEVAQVLVTINFSNSMDYNNWVVLKASETDFDETANYEPQGANMTQGGLTTTTTMLAQVNMNGSGILGNSVPVSGLTASDFALTSNTVVEAILTVVEGAAGLYTVTFAAQTSGDSLALSLASTSGFSAGVYVDLVP